MGWFDDWEEGKVDAWTAINGYFDGEKSPSEKAREQCDYADDECYRETRDREARKATRRVWGPWS
jgi:hypothetical protein